VIDDMFNKTKTDENNKIIEGERQREIKRTMA